MKAFICDRCGQIFNEQRLSWPSISIRIVDGSVARKEMSRGKLQDLCPECYQELKTWFYSAKE